MYLELYRTQNISLQWKLDPEVRVFMAGLFSICPEKSIERNQLSSLDDSEAQKGSAATLEK
tara:strand:- start:564 stop:746 length:183 start_codon:yes stop_codon:yes gene_type:complete